MSQRARRTVLRAPVMLPIASAAVLVLGILAGGVIQASQASRSEPVPSTTLTPLVPPRVVFLGDSITLGTSDLAAGRFGDRSWFAGLVEGPDPALDYVGGIAANGMRTQWMREQAQAALVFRPDLLVVLGGTNDIAAAATPQEVIANLQAIVDLADAQGVAVAVSTIPPADTDELIVRAISLNQAIRQWAPTAGVILLDPWQLLADSAGGWLPGMTDDGIHPNPRACRLMADAAAPVILDAMARRQAG